MAKKTTECYICGNTTTSKEHAPAKSFFPADPEFRKNLIKVHSCAEHNEATSKDDEYVRNLIAMSIGNNAVAFKQFFEKTKKSFMLSPGLLKTTTKNSQHVYADEGQGIKQTLAFEIDRNRVDKVLKKIAYALFYHNHDQIWRRGLIVQSEFFRTHTMEADAFGQLIQKVRQMLGDIELTGDNPQVFKYKFLPTESDDINNQLLVMKFYEGFEVWIAPITGSTSPAI